MPRIHVFVRAIRLLPAAMFLAACATESPRPTPVSPGSVAAETPAPTLPPLECGPSSPDTLGVGGRPAPGTGLRALDELVAATGATPRVSWSADLAAGRIDWLVPTADDRQSVWLVRQVPGGVCVVGSWSPGTPPAGPLNVDAHALVGGVALSLLRFETSPDERSGVATRWTAIATDGRRAWLALEGRGGTQLVAASARLRREGASLFLDVPTASGATAVLKFDGQRFVKLN